MIAVDTNILVYAHRKDSHWHKKAFDKIKGLAEGRAPWAIVWSSLHEFYSVVTHPKIYSPSSTPEQARLQIKEWMKSPSLVILNESEGYWKTLEQLIHSSQIVGPRIHDARIAAVCILHEVRLLWSADRDFSRFGSLIVENPLA